MSKRRYDFCETQFGGTAAEFDCCTEEKAIKEIQRYLQMLKQIRWNDPSKKESYLEISLVEIDEEGEKHFPIDWRIYCRHPDDWDEME